MKKIISLLLIGLFISGCSLLSTHKIDVEQGNIISQKDIRQLQPGMTEAEVKDTIGNPVLINLFSPGQVNYIYTLQEGHQSMTEKRITCIFKQGRLVMIKKD